MECVFLCAVLSRVLLTYLLHVLGLLAPCALLPLLLEVVGIPGLADDTGRRVERELQTELGQLKVFQAVSLSGNTGLRSIDQHLENDQIFNK